MIQQNKLEYLKTWLSGNYNNHPKNKSTNISDIEAKKPKPIWGKEKSFYKGDTLIVEVPTDFDGQKRIF